MIQDSPRFRLSDDPLDRAVRLLFYYGIATFLVAAIAVDCVSVVARYPAGRSFALGLAFATVMVLFYGLFSLIPFRFGNFRVTLVGIALLAMAFSLGVEPFMPASWRASPLLGYGPMAVYLVAWTLPLLHSRSRSWGIEVPGTAAAVAVVAAVFYAPARLGRAVFRPVLAPFFSA